MWTQEKYSQDVRVVVTLLLRINLAKKRFFRTRKQTTTQKPKELKVKTKGGNVTRRLNTLFELLMKVQNFKKNKLRCIEKVLNSLFIEDAYIPSTVASSSIAHTPVADEGM